MRQTQAFLVDIVEMLDSDMHLPSCRECTALYDGRPYGARVLKVNVYRITLQGIKQNCCSHSLRQFDLRAFFPQVRGEKLRQDVLLRETLRADDNTLPGQRL